MKEPIPSSFAVVYTVKNEWRLLKYSIPYLLAAGAAKIYVFFDGTTDEAILELAKYENVATRTTVRALTIEDPPEWIKQIEVNEAEQMDFRKRINMLYAASLANDDGIEWVCSIDADEMLVPGDGFSSISELLASVGSDVDQILMPNIELLPTPSTGENIFKSQTVFIQRKDRLQNLWRVVNALLGKLRVGPKKLSLLEHYFYKVALLGRFPPTPVNPMTGEKVHRGLYLGYNNHKAFMRASRARLFNFNIHKWIKIDRRPKTVVGGQVLHYDLPDAEYFLCKFGQRPSNMHRKVFYTRYQLGMISCEAPNDVARLFFDEQIRVADKDRVESLIKSGIAVEVRTVADFFVSRGAAL
ncbi:glycosyltransferase family 2 protein [Burkholderia sp. BCC1985]|uniref:glycosyltransferase family 2 protein n=1 Tax=Burkholderia sp. BCC1985 TaxID=2817442 RepID=UPI002AB30819|nr:glycosyltransferase family 2 protein [Burkholderia sp. BCC1985]